MKTFMCFLCAIIAALIVAFVTISAVDAIQVRVYPTVDRTHKSKCLCRNPLRFWDVRMFDHVIG